MSVQGIIGKKVGMTQVYAEDGRAYPVTVIEAGPCVVVQRKSKDKDGYSAVQLGLVESRKAKRVTRPMKGHFDKAGLPPCRVLREFRVADGAEVKVGDKVSVDLFAATRPIWSMRRLFLSTTLGICGVQIMASAYLFSIMALPRHTDRAGEDGGGR